VALVGLVLSVAEFAGPRRWRWLLADEETGQPLADHQVDLEGEPGEFEAFSSLYRYLRWHAVPDRRTASEAEIVARVGAWAGAAVLGERVGRAIVEAAPVQVQVQVPAQAGFVLGWPLELAHAGGKPLAAYGDVTLAYDLGLPPGGGRAAARPDELRMLAVFSLPTQTSVLALRRERYELARLVRRIGARQRRRVSLSLLQYGVTRRRLSELVDSGDGWDVLHLSGHGGRGAFLLEREDGSPDEVDTAELARLLRPLRRRVRLAVVSACESAAATTAETLRWVGLEEQAEQLEQEDLPEPGGEPGKPAEPVTVTGIARALVEQLGCAAVAMRYPVTDEFATAFTTELYERVFGRNQELGTALARAVADAAGAEPSPARPAICLATPVLVGAQADQLRLEAPVGQPVIDAALVRMERFPPEPERFVGRRRSMASASAAFAPESGSAGVVLHGMAGSGKTACALELAYRHQDSFAAVAFWQAPETDDAFGEALADLAAALDIQLGGFGFAMSGHITPIAALEAFVPRLRRLLEDNGILLVLDNLETLLTPDGGWRDPRWTPLTAALTGHGGESRVVLTSRIPPAGLGNGVLVLPVHALSLDESAALARELPGLRGLLHADESPLRDADAATVEHDRGLVRRVLHVVQGHPKLMELADATATDPAQLKAQLTTAETAAGGQVLDAFFRDGTTALDAAQFLDTLTGWTTATLAALPEPAQLMARFLACLEDSDRQSVIVDANWADLWQRLDQPGQPPTPAPLLAALAQAALIQPSTPRQDEDGQDAPVTYRMHPGIAQAIHATTSPDVQAATDTELGEFWRQVDSRARQQEGGEAGQVIVRAGLAAAPYLLRLKDWDTAAELLDRAVIRDPSPTIVQAALPTLRAIVEVSPKPEHIARLARALLSIDQVEAEELLRDALPNVAAARNFHLAAIMAASLSDLLEDAGRLGEALDLSAQAGEYVRLAGLGPWTQLSVQGRRLQLLGRIGEHQQVIDGIRTLQGQMDKLPATRGSGELVDPWNVRETILGTGGFSAQALDEWQQALEFNAAILASMRARGASDYLLAYAAYNDSRPLRVLGRFDDLERLLTACQKVFEEYNDLDQLGNIASARANLEGARGNLEAALAFHLTSIRYAYLRREPRDVFIDHYNIANDLWKTGSDPAAQRAHRLAAAIIAQLTGMAADLADTCRLLARELRQDTGQHLPGTLEEVIAVAEQTEGVRLGELLGALQPSTQATEDALAQILRTATGMDPDQDGIQDHLRRWEPVIAATVAAADGDTEAAAELAPVLDEFAQQQDWAALVALLRRILSGERGEGLLEGLDPVDTAIAGQVLARLTQNPAAPREEGS
jgi:tetratricopeptide (TPR) repeat protein